MICMKDGPYVWRHNINFLMKTVCKSESLAVKIFVKAGETWQVRCPCVCMCVCVNAHFPVAQPHASWACEFFSVCVLYDHVQVRQLAPPHTTSSPHRCLQRHITPQLVKSLHNREAREWLSRIMQHPHNPSSSFRSHLSEVNLELKLTVVIYRPLWPLLLSIEVCLNTLMCFRSLHNV